MSTALQFTTADQLLLMPQDGHRFELLEGELRKMSPAGAEHGFVISDVHGLLWTHVRARQLGRVTGAETGFLISRGPDTVLAPDIAFVRQDRIDALGVPKAFFPEAPALVVEVVSPGDTVEEIDNKMRRWFAAGVELAWLVNPSGRTLTVYRGPDDVRILKDHDSLDGGSTIPGFSCEVREMFTALGSK